MSSGKSNKTLIMTILCLATLAANIAYSAVATIFPPTMEKHYLSGIWTSIVIAAYALAQTIFGGFVNSIL